MLTNGLILCGRISCTAGRALTKRRPWLERENGFSSIFKNLRFLALERSSGREVYRPLGAATVLSQKIIKMFDSIMMYQPGQ
ncbi:hypothetical protein NDU88_001366 [Pleurodeles waltl]|uniref:Uncharacterized protein n=1 Tax=Pleurodeles waltl TaxID=8319 RepID=A0AAV7KW46_PLEWA|nr:hypothetical protein NDU88_001366 [Pleurodeles waltl]